jgi:hypothetical protein
MCGDDMSGFVRRGEEVENEEDVVPDENDQEADNRSCDLVDDAHLDYMYLACVSEVEVLKEGVEVVRRNSESSLWSCDTPLMFAAWRMCNYSYCISFSSTMRNN